MIFGSATLNVSIYAHPHIHILPMATPSHSHPPIATPSHSHPSYGHTLTFTTLPMATHQEHNDIIFNPPSAIKMMSSSHTHAHPTCTLLPHTSPSHIVKHLPTRRLRQESVKVTYVPSNPSQTRRQIKLVCVTCVVQLCIMLYIFFLFFFCSSLHDVALENSDY